MNLFRSLVNEVRNGRSATLATIVGGGEPSDIGRQVLFDAEGNIVFAESDIGAIIPYIRTLQPHLMTHTIGGRKMEVMMEPFGSQPTLLIMGSGHIAEYLAAMGSLLSYEIVIVDDRPEYANKITFPYASRIYCGTFHKVLEEVPYHSECYAVLATRGHQTDAICLERLLKTDISYIGMVGSKRKIRSIFSLLKERGTNPEMHTNIYAPVGIDMNSETPQEIALSILTEIQLIRFGGTGRSFSELKRVEKIHTTASGRSRRDFRLLETLATAQDTGKNFTLVSVIGSEGHVPRGVGSHMIVWEDGSTYGTIGGGRRESEIAALGRKALHTGSSFRQEADFGGRYDTAEPVCGGRYTFFIKPYIAACAAEGV